MSNPIGKQSAEKFVSGVMGIDFTRYKLQRRVHNLWGDYEDVLMTTSLRLRQGSATDGCHSNTSVPVA